jgi:MPBQ/MSBQ methyltransferase
MDALNMTFPDNSFDLVWACESGEHMPDKKLYVDEMTRVLKPGGRIVIATWCQRDDRVKPFNTAERKMLDFLYAEWTHPYFISIEDYAALMNATGTLKEVVTDDWNIQTIASWRHSIWVGVFNPWPVIKRPHLWWKCLRDGITLERMHEAFDDGLMQYHQSIVEATLLSTIRLETPFFLLSYSRVNNLFFSPILCRDI